MQQRLGRFEILRRLGQGAMGEVYLGLDPAIGREVALKTIHREAALGAEARERFAREARAAGTLNHPNLVTIHEFGEDQGLLYLAMEYVPGMDLEAMLRDGVLSPTEALELLAQVCDGLAFAHRSGVLHRDIKPSNIRVRREGDRLLAKVMDFGIARVAGSDMTGTGTLLGTFGYMAPEYIRTGVPDERCDLFAVGVILYEALAGHRPFEGDTTATILYRVVNEAFAPIPPERLKGVSPQVAHLVAKALAKDPTQRFPSAEALARALRDARDPAWAGLPGAKPTRPSARPQAPAQARPAPRSRLVWPLVAVACLGGAGALGAWHWLKKAAPPRLITLPPPEAPSPERPADRRVGRPGPRAAQPQPRLSEADAQGLLNEAARGILDQPQGSLTLCDQVLREQPDNPRAHALKVVALYGLGRYQEMPGALRQSREAGLDPARFRAFLPFQSMLREERRERRLPPQVWEALGLEGAPGSAGRPLQRLSRD